MNEIQTITVLTRRPCLAALAELGDGFECRSFLELEVEGAPVPWCGVCGLEPDEHLPDLEDPAAAACPYFAPPSAGQPRGGHADQ